MVIDDTTLDLTRPTRARVLVVDDQPENCNLLRCLLEAKGMLVETVFNGRAALESIQQRPPDTILLDLIMPEMDGFDLCRRLKGDTDTCHIPIIIVTGVNDRNAFVRIVDAGADDVLTKPFDRGLLLARLRNALKMKRLHDLSVAHQHELEERVQERTQEIKRTRQVAVFSLAKLAESRDTETGDHLERIRAYVKELSGELALLPKYREIITEDFIQEIYDSSPLHDIGKVGIPDQILLKPGQLTEEEFEIMKKHTLIGGDTLRAADAEAGQHSFLAMGKDIAYYHHERWDGTGYPFGAGGREIPLAARIVALADVYDALCSKRPYKEPFSHEKAAAIIRAGRGKHFDPEIVDAFDRCAARFDIIRDSLQASYFTPLEILTRQMEHFDAANAPLHVHR